MTDQVCEIAVSIDWREIGAVRSEITRLVFPAAERVPAVYRFRFDVEGERAEYVGEAARVSERFGSYRSATGGLSTNTRMRNRMERSLDLGGSIAVAIARPELFIGSQPAPLDLGNKLLRVFVEHAAATEALSAGRAVLNGRGYPPFPDGHVLSGDPR